MQSLVAGLVLTISLDISLSYSKLFSHAEKRLLNKPSWYKELSVIGKAKYSPALFFSKKKNTLRPYESFWLRTVQKSVFLLTVRALKACSSLLQARAKQGSNWLTQPGIDPETTRTQSGRSTSWVIKAII